MTNTASAYASLRIVSLFSGIGGFELGMSRAGHATVLMCESDSTARSVLKKRFPDVEIAPDITTLKHLPPCDLITAGWPCQDISLAGGMTGITGTQSSLINELFRLLAQMLQRPRFLVLENVAFALDLKGGEAVAHVTKGLSALGYKWAYRILDTRLFGLPQRRRRLFILASLDADPAEILLDGIQASKIESESDPSMVGFYWTEGTRGLGWSPEAIPPLKGGSGLGIPSPPAIWDCETRDFIAPGIEDAERLQGFPSGWTAAAAEELKGERQRWRLVGNAVSVPVAQWLGQRLATQCDSQSWRLVEGAERGLARAASGGFRQANKSYVVSREGAANASTTTLAAFGLRCPSKLSTRAINGFTKRFEVAPLRKNLRFLDDLRNRLAIAQPELNSLAIGCSPLLPLDMKS